MRSFVASLALWILFAAGISAWFGAGAVFEGTWQDVVTYGGLVVLLGAGAGLVRGRCPHENDRAPLRSNSDSRAASPTAAHPRRLRLVPPPHPPKGSLTVDTESLYTGTTPNSDEPLEADRPAPGPRDAW